MTPWKLSIEPGDEGLEEDEGFEDDVHFQTGDFQVPCQ